MMFKTTLVKHWKKMILAAFALAVVGYFGLCLLIGQGVRDAIFVAQRRFPGDPVTALTAMAAAEDQVLSVRNRSIWALGQLGAEQALPVLKSLQSGSRCDHEHGVCQKEVNKAIEACSGGRNIGAWVWRHGDLSPA